MPSEHQRRKGEKKRVQNGRKGKNSNQLISARFICSFFLLYSLHLWLTLCRFFSVLSCCSVVHGVYIFHCPVVRLLFSLSCLLVHSAKPFCLLKLQLRQLSIFLPDATLDRVGPTENTHFFRTKAFSLSRRRRMTRSTV